MASFKNALAGFKVVWVEEQSFRIQLIVAGLVAVLMFVLPLSSLERAVLFLAIGFVLGLEMLNPQLEDILDLVETNHNPKIKRIKDLSAAAVLAAVLEAAIVGFFIFWPYVI